MAGSVNLGARLDTVVDDLVGKGRYGSRSEVLREGVRLVMEREARLVRFEAEIQVGLDAVDRGDTQPAEQVRAELRERFDAMPAKRAA